MGLLPRRLTGRTVLVLLAAVALVHFGSMLIYEQGLPHPSPAAHHAELARRIDAAAAVLATVPPDQRAEAARLLSTEVLRLEWHAGGEGRKLPDGSVLVIEAAAAHDGGAHATLASTSVMVLGVVIVAALLMRSVVAPLRRLAGAADAIGTSAEPPAVAETGPEEVRLVAQAFNRMQARITKLLADRTQALAAVSHDLRTPITRIRLRAGFLADTEAAGAIDRDLDEMEAMVDTTLAYLRGEEAREPARPTDLPALLATLADAEADQGRAAHYDGPAHLTIQGRPVALRRAFANLIGNALAYGGRAEVRLRSLDGAVEVVIADDGPGISAADQARVFEPFVRLEHSRNRATGGVGLGLTIARRAIEAEGGRIVLRNRDPRGLDVVVTLPASG